MSNTYTYTSPPLLVAVDCVIFGFDEGELKLLLIKRVVEPEKDRWSLMGGFVNPDESLDDAARRVLHKLTGLTDVFMEQLYTFGEVERDPAGRVITVIYYALININNYDAKLSKEESTAKWHPVSSHPKLIFDHDQIAQTAYNRLKAKVRYQPIGFELLPEKFTLSQLQNLYEVILGKPLDKRNFRKKILGMDLIIKLKESQKGVAHRAARFYKFDKKRYKELLSNGFNFEI